jgi:hypothetical protein
MRCVAYDWPWACFTHPRSGHCCCHMQVLGMRGSSEAVERLISLFTQELGVYSVRKGNTAFELWERGRLARLVQLE